MKRVIAIAAAALGVSATLVPAHAATEAFVSKVPDAWKFQAIIYGYFPSLGGTVSQPSGALGDVSVSADELLNALNFVFFGTFEVRKGSWGAFTDVMYMDVGDSKSGVRNFTIGGAGLPVNVSANANLDIKATVWTLAATYGVIAEPDAVLDVFAGARLLGLKSSLNWNLVGTAGPITGPGNSGRGDSKSQVTDGLVGAKGRVAFGTDLKWFMPYYADVGTGDSDLTWQLFGGLGYAFNWGSVIAGWRYLDYNFKSGSDMDSMNLNGPMVGVSFRW